MPWEDTVREDELMFPRGNKGAASTWTSTAAEISSDGGENEWDRHGFFLISMQFLSNKD